MGFRFRSSSGSQIPSGFGPRVSDFFRVPGLGFRVYFGLQVSDFRFRVSFGILSDFGFRDSGVGFLSGFGFRVSVSGFVKWHRNEREARLEIVSDEVPRQHCPRGAVGVLQVTSLLTSPSIPLRS